MNVRDELYVEVTRMRLAVMNIAEEKLPEVKTLLAQVNSELSAMLDTIIHPRAGIGMSVITALKKEETGTGDTNTPLMVRRKVAYGCSQSEGK